jgi:sigma-B regulation protein RsbU (phosphoserine phosphatase)
VTTPSPSVVIATTCSARPCRPPGAGGPLRAPGRHCGVVWCSQLAPVIRDATGRPESSVSILEDISERRQQAERAAQIQRGLLPGAAPDISGYQLGGTCLPAENVAGDFYDWTVREGQIDVAIADVMGKGVGAALVMAVLRTALRSCPVSAGPAARVRIAAESISFGDDGLFVTLFYGRMDLATGTFDYVDAGHGYCAILRAGGELIHLPTRSLPLGVLKEGGFSEGSARLEPGDALILYSDGLVEREAGTVNLADITRSLADSPDAEDSVRRLMAAMPGPSVDDVTVVVLRRVPLPVPAHR